MLARYQRVMRGEKSRVEIDSTIHRIDSLAPVLCFFFRETTGRVLPIIGARSNIIFLKRFNYHHLKNSTRHRFRPSNFEIFRGSQEPIAFPSDQSAFRGFVRETFISRFAFLGSFGWCIFTWNVKRHVRGCNERARRDKLENNREHARSPRGHLPRGRNVASTLPSFALTGSFLSLPST